MRRVAKKSRIMDWVLAKSKDNILYQTGVNTPPTTPARSSFRLRNASSTFGNIPDGQGEGFIDIRGIVSKDGIEYHNIIDRFNATGGGYFLSNTSFLDIGNGEKELRVRLPRNQRRNLCYLNWYPVNTPNVQNTHFNLIPNTQISYIDISPLTRVLYFNTVGGRQEFIYDKIDKLQEITMFLSQPNLDLSTAKDLEYLRLNNDIPFDLLLPSKITSILNTVNLSNCSLKSTFVEEFNDNLKTLNLSENPNLGNVDVSDATGLINFTMFNSGLTELDVSANTGLRTLDLGILTNNNNLSNGIVGLDLLTDLRTLILSRSGYVGSIDLSSHPLLNNLDIQRCSGASFDVADIDFTPNLQTLRVDRTSVFGVLDGVVNNNLRRIYIGGTTISYFNSAKYPNVNTVHRDDAGNSPIVFDLQHLTRVDMFLTNNNGTMGVLDFSGVTTANMGNTYFRCYNCPNITKIILPNVQVHDRVLGQTNAAYGTYNLDGLTELVGLNSIVRNNTTLYIPNLALSALDTSYGAGTCLPNVVSLALGGTNDTYTSTAVYDVRKNNLTNLFIFGSHFQVNGSIGTDTCAVAFTIQVEGDSDLSYTTPATFAPTMRRVFLRPNATSGLALDGDQVANLIIDLSAKAWIQGTGNNASINFKGTVYSYRIIDIRGNCAAPTPSQALTDAIALLNTKNVTTLTN